MGQEIKETYDQFSSRQSLETKRGTRATKCPLDLAKAMEVDLATDPMRVGQKLRPTIQVEPSNPLRSVQDPNKTVNDGGRIQEGRS